MVQNVGTIFKKDSFETLAQFEPCHVRTAEIDLFFPFLYERNRNPRKFKRNLASSDGYPKIISVNVKKNGGFPVCFTTGSLYVADFDWMVEAVQ